MPLNTVSPKRQQKDACMYHWLCINYMSSRYLITTNMIWWPLGNPPILPVRTFKDNVASWVMLVWTLKKTVVSLVKPTALKKNHASQVTPVRAITRNVAFYVTTVRTIKRNVVLWVTLVWAIR